MMYKLQQSNFDLKTGRQMRRKNYKLRQYPLNGAKINCASFSQKIIPENSEHQQSAQNQEYFVTGDTHNNVKFYSFSGEEQLNCFTSSTSSTVQAEVSAVAISLDEKNIFSGSNRGIINIWDILSTKTTPSCTLKGHATSVNCFGLFPQQDNRIASGSYDTHIKLWDIREKNNIGILKHHTKPINSIDVSPDCHFLLSGSEDTTVKLWDMRYPEKVVCTYSEHSAPVLKVKFNPQDCMFISSSTDRTAKYFRCQSNHYDYISTTELVSMPITAVDFNVEGTRLCTAGNDILKIWNMNMNGILTETIESAWKGVQDISWGDKGIKGIASHGGYLSTWFCYLDGKKVLQNLSESESKLPRIFRNPSLKVENEQGNSKNKRIGSNKNFGFDSRQLNEKEKDKDKESEFEEIRNNIDFVNNIVNNIEENKANKEKEREAEKKKQELREKARIYEQERREKVKIQKEKEKEERQKKQRQRQQRIQREKEEEERLNQERLEALAKERTQRQRILQEKLHQTFEKNNNKNFQMTLEPDILQHSSAMNLSTFMGDGLQKQKLMQIELIGDFMKESGKFESVYTIRSKNIRPIIHLWKSGKIQNAINTLERADLPIVYDTVSAILHNQKFKFGITPDVACVFIRKLVEIMHNKHSTYVKNSMYFLNDIVLIFKDELIKVKTFNPLTRVDLSREERMAKYDRLTEELLNTFKNEKLKKYAMAAKNNESEQVCIIAQKLYKNLEEVLRKIMPNKQPQPVA